MIRGGDASTETRLVRRLGLGQAIAIALGAMLGAGVYVSMGEAARRTGGSLVLAVLVGAGVATLNGLSSAELGAYDPRAGGAYQFARTLVSPLLGFLAGWVFLFAALAAGGTYALTFSAYLAPLLPWIPARGIGLVLVLGAVGLNLLGVRVSGRASVLLVLANVAVLLAFVALALPSFQASRLQPFLVGGLTGLLQASALLFFAYTGYARPVTVAEEVRNPREVLPRAVPAAVGIAGLLYLAVAFAALGAVGPERFGAEPAPLRGVMLAVGSPVGPPLLSLGAILATSSVLLTEILGLSRLAFAMARNGDLPGRLARLSGRERIPRNSVLVAGAVLVALTALADLRPLLEASSLALLVYYGIMSLSALRLPERARLYPAAVPAAGLAANVLVALSLPWQTLLVVAVVAAVGLGYWSLRRRGVG